MYLPIFRKISPKKPRLSSVSISYGSIIFVVGKSPMDIMEPILL